MFVSVFAYLCAAAAVEVYKCCMGSCGRYYHAACLVSLRGHMRFKVAPKHDIVKKLKRQAMAAAGGSPLLAPGRAARAASSGAGAAGSAAGVDVSASDAVVSGAGADVSAGHAAGGADGAAAGTSSVKARQPGRADAAGTGTRGGSSRGRSRRRPKRERGWASSGEESEGDLGQQQDGGSGFDQESRRGRGRGRGGWRGRGRGRGRSLTLDSSSNSLVMVQQQDAAAAGAEAAAGTSGGAEVASAEPAAMEVDGLQNEAQQPTQQQSPTSQQQQQPEQQPEAKPVDPKRHRCRHWQGPFLTASAAAGVPDDVPFTADEVLQVRCNASLACESEGPCLFVGQSMAAGCTANVNLCDRHRVAPGNLGQGLEEGASRDFCASKQYSFVHLHILISRSTVGICYLSLTC